MSAMFCEIITFSDIFDVAHIFSVDFSSALNGKVPVELFTDKKAPST